MVTPELEGLLRHHNFKSVIIMGIEVRARSLCTCLSSHCCAIQAHICVLISCLDLLSLGYDVHILADGVSSSNKQEVPFALERMRQAGAVISTSESIAFQLQCILCNIIPITALTDELIPAVDSAKPNFKMFAGTIKEEKDRTREVLQAMLPLKSGFYSQSYF